MVDSLGELIRLKPAPRLREPVRHALAIEPVRGRDVGEPVELQTVPLAEPGERPQQPVAVDHHAGLGPGQDQVGEALPEGRQGVVPDQLILPSVRIFPCRVRIPYISISGRGGHPGTYTSTGTIVSTPWTSA